MICSKESNTILVVFQLFIKFLPNFLGKAMKGRNKEEESQSIVTMMIHPFFSLMFSALPTCFSPEGTRIRELRSLKRIKVSAIFSNKRVNPAFLLYLLALSPFTIASNKDYFGVLLQPSCIPFYIDRALPCKTLEKPVLRSIIF